MIYLHPPFLKNNEKNLVNKCIKKEWLSSSGIYVRKFEDLICKYTKSKYSVGLVNGTSALHLALKAIKADSTSEIIVPAISFISTANVVLYCGSSPIFIGVDKNFNICEEKVLEFLRKKTYYRKGNTYNFKTNKKIIAIIVVHAFGSLCKLDKLVSICKKKNIYIIEDAAESLGAYYKSGVFKNRHAGTIGDIGCLSFNVNKILTTGGGGMILTKKKNIAKKVFYLSNQAKSDPINFKHNCIGYNYRLNNINAAIGIKQFERINHFLYKKKKIHDIYKKLFLNDNRIKLIETPNYCSSNYWLNLIKINSYKDLRADLISFLLSNKIEVRPVWYPLYLQKMFVKFERYRVNEVINNIKNVICLPSGVSLKKLDILCIKEKLDYFLRKSNII